MNELFSPDGWLNVTISMLQDYIWTYLLIAVLIGCALWFTIRTRFAQFTMVGEMFRLLGDSGKKDEREKKHISSFQAFAVGVATRVGTGNMAGVAIAISIGGAGSVFWMWLIALLGSATAFVESTLAQLYKTKGSKSFVGGPAYYIKKGLHQPWMGALFAVLISITFGLSYNSIQANTVCSAMENAFGFERIYVGIALAAVALVIVFGGIHRIAKFSSVIVPIMAGGYVLLALFVVFTNLQLVPEMFHNIFAEAFGWRQVGGGTLGAVLMTGIKRGLFSNEAGEGSAPNAAATASVSHPVKQGLIQALGVFTDTLLICSCTAFIILLSGVYNTSAADGIVLTQTALESEVGGVGSVFVAVAILLFAFSSIIGNYYYGEANILYLTNRKWVLTLYRILSAGVVVLFGAVASLQLVWSIGDLFMALLTICNLIAIIFLGKYAFRLLDDYRAQKRAGKDPVFHKNTLPEIEDEIECWD